MKIGMISPYDWSHPGGVRDHIRQLSEQLCTMGHDIRILAPMSGVDTTMINEPGESSPLYIYNMGRARPVPINGSIARIAWSPDLAWRVRDVLEHEHFDILHIHEPLIPGLPLLSLRLSRSVTVGTFHAFARSSVTSTSYLVYASATPFLRPHFRRLAGHIAVSTAAHQFVAQHFPADYHVIPNGINLERFNQRVMPLTRFMDSKKNILFVGRFERRKGIKYLLRAIPLIRARHPNTRFIFVGDGHLRPEIQHYVVQQGWSDIIFTGYIPDKDLPRYYASAHVFCAPATGEESMGIVLLEAMASGTPIVATNIAGYATVVSPGVDGLLTQPRNSLELAHAIDSLLDNAHLRQQLVQAGLYKAREYAWPHVAHSVMDYYYTLLYEHATSRQTIQV